jgi:hypothetical protein
MPEQPATKAVIIQVTLAKELHPEPATVIVTSGDAAFQSLTSL